MACPYETLGVRIDSKPKEIKDAYRSLVLKYHPDKYANASAQEQVYAKRRFQQIAEAFEVLGDRSSRQRYDSRGYGPGGYGAGSSASYGPRAHTSTPYTYKSGWHQYSRRNDFGSRFRATVTALSRVRPQEVMVMFGLVTVVLFGTNAADSALTSMWNANNKGKLYSDITSSPPSTTAKARTKRKSSAPRKRDRT